jgi:hypothetical protein
MRSSNLGQLRGPKKYGMAADRLKSGFYARSPAKAEILDRSDLTFPTRPPKKKGSRLSILIGPVCHDKCIGKIGMILCIVF